MTERIKVYTDGACNHLELTKLGRRGPGGWGVAICNNDGIVINTLKGGEDHTTSNRMEITAAIKALEHLDIGVTAEICTDSIYLLQGITNWINDWRNNDWQRKNGLNLRNADLWKKLDQLNKKSNIKWTKVNSKEIKPAHNVANEGKRPFLQAYKQEQSNKK